MTTTLRHAFVEAADAGVLDYRGVTGEGDQLRHVVALRSGREIEIPAGDAAAWLRGYRAAASAGRRKHAGGAADTRIRQLLADPSLADQARLHILAAMQADGVSVATLADRVGHTEKTIGSALRFGNYITIDYIEAMIRALGGRRWRLFADRGGAAAGVDVLGDVDLIDTGRALDRPADFVRRWERILAAVDAGWVRYTGPDSPNVARHGPHTARETTFTFTVGRDEHAVRARDVDAWLVGIADFHDGNPR